MQSPLKLTITAVGEPDSVFLTPCEPITLHESACEVAAARQAADDDGETVTAADALADLAGHEMMVLVDDDFDTPPVPLRRSA